MKIINLTIYLLGAVISLSCISSDQSMQSEAPEKAILIFTKTEGYRHASIPEGVAALKSLARQHDIATFHTENAAYFQTDSLAKFDAVVFLSTTGDILSEQQQQAFRSFIEKSGGFMGIHAAADTEYDWPWYGQLVGAYFESHPEIQEAAIEVTDKSHPATSFLPDRWVRTDEWYNYKDISQDITVLLQLDESSYEGGKNGANHPIAWYHAANGGRVFYTGGGHTSESYSEDLFRKHLWGGLQYVLGD